MQIICLLNSYASYRCHYPNVKALAVLSVIRKRREGKTQPGSGDARDYLREARSGGMYGYDPEDDSSMRGD